MISKDKDYFYPASTTFAQTDFSWREFVSNLIPLLGNWLRVTQNKFPLPLLQETVSCLKKLHKTCDPILHGIWTLLFVEQFDEKDKIIKYLEGNEDKLQKYLEKYLRDNERYFVIYNVCCHLKKYCLSYPKKYVNFKKICYKSKKNFLVTKKFFDLAKKNNLFNKKIFFCCSAH